jgi:PHD/YefM family antitoxin component YafN of YafNO toxin-antitoxin module
LVLENDEPAAVLVSIEQWNSMEEKLSLAEAQVTTH